MSPPPDQEAAPPRAPSSTPVRKDSKEGGHRERIGNYILGAEIGRGSFATVYKGYHRNRTQVAVAIKAVSRQKLTAKLLENLESEINILKAISHKNIVALEECFKNDTHIYLVMEYCTGSDLSFYIKNRGKLPTLDFVPRPSAFIGLGITPPPSGEEGKVFWPHPAAGGIDERVTRCFLGQLAQALKFLRSQNLIHRDIKPQNLLLQPATASEVADGQPLGIPILKVADFGFARILPAAAMAETLCGSPLYMAPEILRYEKYGAEADLWSVGAVLFEMAAGKPPFRANNHVELLRKIERGEDKIKFPDESSRSSTSADAGGKDAPPPVPVSQDIKALIRRLLKRKPAERMGFEEFFNCGVWEGYMSESITSSESLGPDVISQDSSDLLASRGSSIRSASRRSRGADGLERDQEGERRLKEAIERERERARDRSRQNSDSTMPGRRDSAAGTEDRGLRGAGGTVGTGTIRAPQPLAVDPALNPHIAPVRETEKPPSPIAQGGIAPLQPIKVPIRRSEPKYFVGDEPSLPPSPPNSRAPPPAVATARPPHANIPPFAIPPAARTNSAAEPSRPAPSNQAPMSSPNGQPAGPSGSSPLRSGASPRPISSDTERRSSVHNQAGEDVQSTSPSCSTGAGPPSIGQRTRVVEGSPLASTPPITMSHDVPPDPRGEVTGKPESALEGSDSVLGREYVVVEKQTVLVNALADELDQASRANQALVRRPSSRTSIVTRPVSSFRPIIPHSASSPADPSRAGNASSPTSAISSSPTAEKVGTVQAVSYSPPFTMSTTPPFAIPPLSHRASSSLTRPPSVPQQLNVFPPIAYSPDAPYSLPRLGSSPSSLQTGALARALTNTAIRMIGQGANTAATVIARAASKRRPTIIRTGEMDEVEEQLLKGVEDAARKAFVLFELGDSRLAAWHALSRRERGSSDRERAGEQSSPVPVPLMGLPGGPGPAAGGSPSPGAAYTGGPLHSKRQSSSSSVNSEILILRQQETAAGEACVLYCKALGFIVKGTNAIQSHWDEAGVGYGAGLELNEMMQWLRARFNECYEKTEWAKARCADDLPYIEKLIHDRARETSREAARAELQNELQVAEVGYENSLWLLMASLDDVAESTALGGVNRDEDKMGIEKLIAQVQYRLDALRRKISQDTKG